MTQPIDNNPLRVVVDNSVTDSTEDYRRLEDLDLNSSAYYENRELSYLKFNFRVLEQAKNNNHPLLERLTFLLIFTSNLDEFYEIRVSGLKKQLEFGRQGQGADGKYPEQTLKEIHEQVREALDEQYRI